MTSLPELQKALLAAANQPAIGSPATAMPAAAIGSPAGFQMTFGKFLVACALMIGTMLAIKSMQETEEKEKPPVVSEPEKEDIKPKLEITGIDPEPEPMPEPEPEPGPGPEVAVVPVPEPAPLLEPDPVAVTDPPMIEPDPVLPLIDPGTEPVQPVAKIITPGEQEIIDKYVSALERAEPDADSLAAAKISSEIVRIRKEGTATAVDADDPPVLKQLKPILASELAKLQTEEMPELTVVWQVDNKARLLVNGEEIERSIAWDSGDAPRRKFYAKSKLKAGDVIGFRLEDHGGPEGFIAAVMCGNRFLFGTGGDWQTSLDGEPADTWFKDMNEPFTQVTGRSDFGGGLLRYFGLSEFKSDLSGIWGEGNRRAAVRKVITAEDLRGVEPFRNMAGAPKSEPPTPESLVFVNSLGMEFSPVPESGVLMCKTETRLSDYRQFMKETNHVSEGRSRRFEDGAWFASNRSWHNMEEFELAEDSPVISVNLRDAQEFCIWLTERERAAGWINERSRYWLPSVTHYDKVWGSGIYPWGEEWPPPKGFANLPGLEAVKARNLWFPNKPLREEESWRDDWDYMSPVKATRPNTPGFYGLVGNAAEMVNEGGVTGGSWFAGNRLQCMKGQIAEWDKTVRMPHIGFRCVLLFD